MRYSGLFISETEFEIRSKWEMSFGSRPYKSQPPIYGLLSPINSETTKVELKVRHKIFKGYMILPFLLPLYLIVSGLFIFVNVDIVIAGVVSLMFLSGFYFFAFNVSYNNLISELTVQLKLKRTPEAK